MTGSQIFGQNTYRLNRLVQLLILCQPCYTFFWDVILLLHVLQQISAVEVCLVASIHKAIVQQECLVGLLSIADCGLERQQLFSHYHIDITQNTCSYVKH